ncbi:MAG TPA: urate oxidase [Vicinamibacterales bacterium]|nr:urate oxidase [Vicinamibacterales bacterium]
MIAWNRYGKSRVRLVKVDRSAPTHRLVDLTIDVQLEGAFERVYTDGDNAACLPTDTMKNTVYALARQHPIDRVETFLVRLADHFIAKPGVARARISAAEQPWGRLSDHAFVHASGEQWTALVVRTREAAEITSGITNLVLLKTTDSAFSGFPRDEYTTLPDTRDRILATAVTAAWRYRPHADFAVRDRIRSALVESFAAHVSESVQHTLDAMGRAALAAAPDAIEITLTLPNRHHLLVDLSPFGLDNPNEIFVATDQPFGLIEATITR